ncbi:unnamed protein product [Polarella glacialis]|uniref:Uncharacterized protein n=1 Tax=Polarella glacialis TaxID=89957 RepID=A0A813FIT6_POLGL|nr:unnamed protein product [Polarella glacialis]
MPSATSHGDGSSNFLGAVMAFFCRRNCDAKGKWCRDCMPQMANKRSTALSQAKICCAVLWFCCVAVLLCMHVCESALFFGPWSSSSSERREQDLVALWRQMANNVMPTMDRRGGAAGARLVTAASCRDKSQPAPVHTFVGIFVVLLPVIWEFWNEHLGFAQRCPPQAQRGLQIMVPFLEAQVREALSLVALPAMYSHLSQPREAFKLPHAAAAICNDQQDAEEPAKAEANVSQAASKLGVLPTVGCCGSRANAAMLCFNDRLNSFLEQLELQDQEFDSAYLYRQEVRTGPRMASQQYILLYQRTELVREQSAAGEASLLSPRKVRRELRIDWGRDGLAFTELDRRLSDDMLIRSKVFDPPLKPSQLLKELSEVQGRFFDPEEWASYNFCFHMIDQAPGKEYEYR